MPIGSTNHSGFICQANIRIDQAARITDSSSAAKPESTVCFSSIEHI